METNSETKKIKFLNKAHEENYKKAMVYLNRPNRLPINYEEELERHKRISQLGREEK